MEIRPVHAEEYDLAGRLVVAAYRALSGMPLGEYEVELADVAGRAAEVDVLVAVDDLPGPSTAGRLLGCVTLVPEDTSPRAEGVRPGEAGLRMLAVDPAAQGRGVGGALLEACLHRARELGREAVFLHSTPWMTAAHRLYGRAGFVRVPDRDWLPEPDVPLLAFRLAL